MWSLASDEGWLGVLANAADATEVDMVKIKGANRYYGSIFMIVVLFIISLLFLNLFIGVVIETFNR